MHSCKNKIHKFTIWRSNDNQLKLKKSKKEKENIQEREKISENSIWTNLFDVQQQNIIKYDQIVNLVPSNKIDTPRKNDSIEKRKKK